MTQNVEKDSLKPRQRAFLAAFCETASVKAAAKASKVDPSRHSRWMKEQPAYAAAFAEARSDAAQILEDEAVRRAHKGVLKPVLWQGRPQYEITKDARTGEITGRTPVVIREYSDSLMQTLLKAWMPERYRERHEVKVKGKLKFEGRLDELLALYRDLTVTDEESVA